MHWKQLFRFRLSSLLCVLVVIAVLLGWWRDHRQLTQLRDACLDRFGNDVLEKLATRRLIKEACNRSGIMVTDWDVDLEIVRMAQTYGMSDQQWYRMLEEKGFSRSDYREDVVMPSLFLQELKKNSPTEYATFLADLRR